MEIGLFFGSFNPVHTGHMIIANGLLNHTSIEQIWMVVSPHNPLKKKATLANDFDRLHLVNLAIGDNLHIKASNIEFNLPRPSYTIDTLAYLQEKYSQHHFSLIMGGDNLISLPRWKNYETILANHRIYVYQRPTYPLTETITHDNIQIVEDLPQLYLSSTYIRKAIADGQSVQYLVPDKVFEYLSSSTMYRLKKKET